jgi:GTP-binding protein EngB required for normal cell division
MAGSVHEQSEALLLVEEIVRDLDWLQQRLGANTNCETATLNLARLAGGLTRNVIAPFLRNQKSSQLHVAVVGGAGTGKSTVANLLLGQPLAESNPQAGFTRHPVAYVPQDGRADWTEIPGLLTPLRRLPVNQPANLDEDVYQVRRFIPASGDDLLRQAVVWDCPDVTTWQSVGYLPRVLEIVSLADVVVYVASDERYNDEIPTQLLRLLMKSGKTVVCVLTKMREASADKILEDFRKKVLNGMPNADGVRCVAVPFLDSRILSDPAGQCGRWRQRLLDSLQHPLSHPVQIRRSTVRGAINFLDESKEELQAGIAEDLAALNTWKELVEQGRTGFEERFRREYLTNKRFQYQQEMREMLNVSLRWFERIVVNRVLPPMRSPAQEANYPHASLDQVVATSVDAWLDSIHAQTARRKDRSHVFDEISKQIAKEICISVKSLYKNSLAMLAESIDVKNKQLAQAVPQRIKKARCSLYLNVVLWLFVPPVVLYMLLPQFFSALMSWLKWPEVLGLLYLCLIICLSAKRVFTKLCIAYANDACELIMQSLQTIIATPVQECLSNWPLSNIKALSRLKHVEDKLAAGISRLKHLVFLRIDSDE